MTDSDLGRMKAALATCRFLPGHPDKRFARDMANVPVERVTERQRRHIIRLAWRYRRSMPADLVPGKDAVTALDARGA